jgi:hypothetical protein
VEADVLRLVPEEDSEQWVYQTGYLENAGFAVLYAARTRKEDSTQDAAWAARQVFDAADYAAWGSLGYRGFGEEVGEQLVTESAVMQAARTGLAAILHHAEDRDGRRVKQAAEAAATVFWESIPN